MKPEIAQDGVARQRFLREARVMASLNSDYVVTVHQVGVHKNIPFLAAEFLHGESLDRWLEHRGRLSVPKVLRLSIAAHEHGLIHRDIKPANIFLETQVERHGDGGVRRGAVTPIALRRAPQSTAGSWEYFWWAFQAELGSEAGPHYFSGESFFASAYHRS